MTDLEQRLHAAYAAKAATITEDRLRPDGPFGTAPLAPVVPLRRRRTPFLAAAAVAALGAGIAAAVVFAGGTPTPPAHPGPVSTAHRTAQPTGPATPTTDVLPRSAVPWAQVGSGWTVVQRDEANRTTVELVSPAGTAYRIAMLPPGDTATLWSPDHERLLIGDGTTVQELTMRTGAVHTIPLPPGAQPVSYTRPRGTALLVVYPDPGGGLRRYDAATGALQQVYPRSASGAGKLRADTVLYDADGGMLALSATNGIAVLTNGGHLVRALPSPGAVTCFPVRWEGTSALTAFCGGLATGNVWRLPLDGTAPVQLTHGPHGADIFGYSDIWSYDGGRLGLAPNGCGPASLVRFDAAGIGTEVDVPLPRGVRGPFEYVGHHDAVVRLLGHSAGQCSPSGFVLLSYDAAANTTTVLAPAADSDGALQPAVLVPPGDS